MSKHLADASPKRRWFSWLIAAFFFAWTFGHSFLGIDLVDTGYYYYQYLYPRADNISYAGYLATLIGATWIRVFPGLGLWGLNLLELIMEYLLCAVVYFTFRKTFRRESLLLSILFCMVALSTYVNIFNYHQLSMFFCTAMLCFMYTGLRKERARWQMLAGAMAVFAAFSRFTCVLCLVCLLCIVYWRLVVSRRFKKLLCELALFIAGYAAVLAVIILALKLMGVFSEVLGDVARLSNLGNSGSTTYQIDSQLSNLLTDTLHGVEAALLFIVSGAALCAAVWIVFRYVRRASFSWQATVLTCIGSMLGLAVGVAGGYYAMYVVGRAPAYVQLTSFSWFIYGMLFVVGVVLSAAGIVLFAADKRHARLAGEKLPTKGYPKTFRFRRDCALGFMGIALVMLSFIGSAARVKHAILGMWILAPLVLDRVFDLLSSNERLPLARIKSRKPWLALGVCLTAAVFMTGFGWFVAITNNFDDPDRTKLTAEINSDKLCFLRTTQREADAVNEVLEAVMPYRSDNGKLMVLGNSVLFYALLEEQAYVRPWVSGTSYLYNELAEDLELANTRGEPLPVIIEALTDSYQGFSEEDYQELYSKQLRSNERSLKYQVVREFMTGYSYKKLFSNDYFVVWIPALMA